MNREPITFRAEDLLSRAAWVRRLAAELVTDTASADDLVQDTFLAFLRRPPRADRPLEPWLARVVKNLARNRRRDEAQRLASAELPASDARAVAPDQLAEELEAQRVLVEEVQALAEPLRSTIVLRWLRGLDANTIAKLQGVPASTVRWRSMRGLEELRARLDRRFGGDRNAWCVALAPLGMRAARAGTSLSGASTAESAGGWIMHIGTKLALAAVLVVIVGVAVWPLVGGSRSSIPALVRTDAGATTRDETETRAESLAMSEQTEVREPASARASGDAAPESLQTEACCLVGRVLDASGEGLSGAQVLAVPARVSERSALFSGVLPDTHVRTTTTDARGVFRIEVPPARAFALVAEHDQCAPAAISPCFAGERKDLTLSAGGSLRIAVHAAGDLFHPLSGVRVRAEAFAPDSPDAYWSEQSLTDVDGETVIALVPLDEVRVSATLAGSAPAEARVRVSAAQETLCDLVLESGGDIAGVVVVKSSGRPIAGATIGFERGSIATSDEQGNFSLRDLRLGQAVLTVTARRTGYMPESALVKLTREEPRRALRFELEAALCAHGRVQDSGGRPLALTLVFSVGNYSTGPFSGETVETSTATLPDGSFELLDLRAGTEYRLVLANPRFGTGVALVGPFERTRDPIDLGSFVLDAPCSLAGEVLGLVLPEQWTNIHLYWTAGAQLSGRESPPVHLDSARTDPSGRFAFDRLAAGQYLLELIEPPTQSQDCKPRSLAHRTIALAPGDHTRGIQLSLGAHAVIGRVTDEAGEGLRGIALMLHPANEQDRVITNAYSDSEGRFRLAVESDGPFRLALRDDTLLHEPLALDGVFAAEQELTLRLVAHHTTLAVRGRIVDSSGTAVSGVYVAFSETASGRRLARVGIPNDNGRFQMTDLDDVLYDVELVDFAGRYEPVRMSGVRPNGEEIELRVASRR